MDLVDLCLFQVFIFTGKKGAGVIHSLVQPDLIKIIALVIVELDILPALGKGCLFLELQPADTGLLHRCQLIPCLMAIEPLKGVAEMTGNFYGAINIPFTKTKGWFTEDIFKGRAILDKDIEFRPTFAEDELITVPEGYTAGCLGIFRKEISEDFCGMLWCHFLLDGCYILPEK